MVILSNKKYQQLMERLTSLENKVNTCATEITMLQKQVLNHSTQLGYDKTQEITAPLSKMVLENHETIKKLNTIAGIEKIKNGTKKVDIERTWFFGEQKSGDKQ